ncbi:TonB-dependent receptor [Pseudomonas aeruginosa]|nr:TonB-dependent receptor [Pseudomonas aeruginosa]
MPDYTLVDARIGYDLGKLGLKGLDVSLNANNLLDKDHGVLLQPGLRCYFGEKRNVTATVNYQFSTVHPGPGASAAVPAKQPGARRTRGHSPASPAVPWLPGAPMPPGPGPAAPLCRSGYRAVPFLAGLTGSLLAFHRRNRRMAEPRLLRRGRGRRAPFPGQPGATRRVTLSATTGVVHGVSRGGRASGVARHRAAREAGAKVEHDVFYLDPVSGEEVGKRLWAACCFQPANLVSWVLEFHHNLSPAGELGAVPDGRVAMFWFLDCFVGAWLDPAARPAVLEQVDDSLEDQARQRLPLQLRPASRRRPWLWLLLAPVALSSVASNLPSQVFKPLVSLFSPIEPERLRGARAAAQGATGETRLDYDRTFQLASVEAARLGIAEPIGELYYSFEYNFFGAGFGDHDDPMGKSWLFFHGSDGRLLGQEVAGQGSWGERFYRLQYPIHGGRIAGLPGRIAIAALGLAIAGLSLTGVYIWWRKRRARHWNGR